MGRESKKQIKAQLINEVAKTYTDRLQREQDKFGRMYHTMKNITDKLKKENLKLQEENLKLQEKVEQQEDWIRRLQEFMDMDVDTRQETIAQYRTSKELNDRFSNIIGMYEKMFKIF